MIDVRSRRHNSPVSASKPYKVPVQIDIRVEHEGTADHFMRVLNSVLVTMGMKLERIHEPANENFAIYRYKRA